MQTDDQPQGNPDAQEIEGGEGSSLPSNPSSGDPFDGMTHEQILAEAKKQRAILQRAKEAKAEKPASQPAVAPSAPTDVLTKQDFYRINSNKARDMLKADPAMADFADDIANTYVNRRGQDTPEAIFADLQDAFAVVRFRNPAKADNPAADLQTTPYVKPSSPRPQGQEAKKSVIPKKESIDQWFKKK